jgi:hypothetical protein
MGGRLFPQRGRRQLVPGKGGRRRGGSAVGAALMIATFSAIPPRWRVGVAE